MAAPIPDQDVSEPLAEQVARTAIDRSVLLTPPPARRVPAPDPHRRQRDSEQAAREAQRTEDRAREQAERKAAREQERADRLGARYGQRDAQHQGDAVIDGSTPSVTETAATATDETSSDGTGAPLTRAQRERAILDGAGYNPDDRASDDANTTAEQARRAEYRAPESTRGDEGTER
jgi:hypothetical protein